MEHRDTISYFLGWRLPTFSDWWIKIVWGLRTVTGSRLLSYINFLITAGINIHIYHGSRLVEPCRAIRNATRAPRFVWPFGDSDQDMFASRCDPSIANYTVLESEIQDVSLVRCGSKI
jgi:hypothetical protein